MTIAFGAVGTKSAGGTTTLAIPYPASVGAGNLVIAGRALWMNAITATAETGWTAGSDGTGGTGTAADAHTGRARCDYREAAGGETGNITFDQGGTADGGVGIMARYTKDAAKAWDVANLGAVTDGTHGANWATNATASHAFQAGDCIVAVVEVDTDAALTITAPFCTIGGGGAITMTRRTSGAGVVTGNDGNVEIFDVVLTAPQAATGGVAFAFTCATSTCGAVALLRLREVTPTVTATPVPATLTIVPATITLEPATYVGSSSGGRNGAGTFSVPNVATAVGQIAIAQWHGTTGQKVAPPAGWTELLTGRVSDDFTNYGIWVANSPPASDVWTQASTLQGVAVLVRGYNRPVGLEQAPVGTNGSLVAPTLTTALGPALIERFLFAQSFSGTPTIGYPAGTSGQAQKIQAPAEFFSVAAANTTQGAVGAAGTATFTHTGNSLFASRSMTLAVVSLPSTAASVSASPLTASLAIVPAEIQPVLVASPLGLSLSLVATGVVPNVAASPLSLSLALVAAGITLPAPTVNASPLVLSLAVQAAVIKANVNASPLALALGLVPAVIKANVNASPLGLGLSIVPAGLKANVTASPLALSLALPPAGVVPVVIASPLALGLALVAAQIQGRVNAVPLGLSLALVPAVVQPTILASPLGLALALVPSVLKANVVAVPLPLGLAIIPAGLTGPGLTPSVAASPLLLSLAMVPAGLTPNIVANRLGITWTTVPASLTPNVVAQPLSLTLSMVPASLRPVVLAQALQMSLAIVQSGVVGPLTASTLSLVLEIVAAQISSGPVRSRTVSVRLGATSGGSRPAGLGAARSGLVGGKIRPTVRDGAGLGGSRASGALGDTIGTTERST